MAIKRSQTRPTDIELYTLMWDIAHDPTTCCEITGLSLHDLRKVRDSLSLDRIDNDLGYIQGNIRIIATSLNAARGDNTDVPPRAISKLTKRLSRIIESRLSRAPKAKAT